MLNLDPTTFNIVVETACADAAAHVKWLTAIGRAVVELTSNPYLERQDGHLLIASPSGALYAANGVCQCMAYTYGNPCWHRAAARLVRRHDELQALRIEVVTGVEAGIAPLSERLKIAREQMAELFA